MSSTNRGAVRQEFDYYATDPAEVEKFLRAWATDEEHGPDGPIQRVLDPCAGGNVTPVQWTYKEATAKKPAQVITVPPTPMAYPLALNRTFTGLDITTNDIRPDSPAQYHIDAQKLPALTKSPYDLVITNPPFFLAMEVILASLELVRPGGYVVMLLRLNWYGSDKRRAFLRATPPYAAYVHPDRMGFLPGPGTDSIEYQHAVWQRGRDATFTALKVL